MYLCFPQYFSFPLLCTPHSSLSHCIYCIPFSFSPIVASILFRHSSYFTLIMLSGPVCDSQPCVIMCLFISMRVFHVLYVHCLLHIFLWVCQMCSVAADAFLTTCVLMCVDAQISDCVCGLIYLASPLSFSLYL